MIKKSGAERNAVNAPIQGLTDIIKIAMINIHKKLVSENWKSETAIAKYNDELVFEVHNSELEKSNQ